MTKGDLPIGVFDSGLGGLTVLKVLAEKLPNESFYYLGDTARLPYGNKSPQTIKQYLKKCLYYLTQKKVKALVVACNSASSVLDFSEMDGAPVYNVIQPGAIKAATQTTNKRIGVLGTRATVSQKAYVKALEMIDPEFKIYQQACPLFVPLVEEGWIDDPLTNLVVYRYLNPLLGVGIDTLILGCTHYPVLKTAIAKVTGPHIELVDSSESIAELIQLDMEKGRLPRNENPTEHPLQIFTTDANEDFLGVAKRILNPLNIEQLKQVDI